jgi:Domain of unknown function (DUF4032)
LLNSVGQVNNLSFTSNEEIVIVITQENIQFHLHKHDKKRLEGLPWGVQLNQWEQQGIPLLVIRRGDSRHPVVFVEREGARYAIKETTPHMAEREIRNLREIERRGIPALSPVGEVVVPAPPVTLNAGSMSEITQYVSGDRGYTITRLAPRVIPHVILFRLPLTKRTKQRLLSAVAVLMIELHEHGVYWGDPSLANVLMRIDGRRILAIMADAETSELFPGPISEGLREQDMALFGESLAWQAEDLRIALGLPEDAQPLDEGDFRYFERHYRLLRREHARIAHTPGAGLSTISQAGQIVQSLNQLGVTLLSASGRALREVGTVMPGWYQRRIYELLHISVPRIYARRFYNMILGHQSLMSEKAGHEVGLEEAAQDWYTHYHLPAILLLRQTLTSEQDPMQAYFEIMDHKWDMSVKAGHEVPLEDAIVDWSMQRANTGKLGIVDPATVATWWHDRKSVANALEPPLIQGDDLEHLLSTKERPLVHLQLPELEEKLPQILSHSNDAKEEI